MGNVKGSNIVTLLAISKVAYFEQTIKLENLL